MSFFDDELLKWKVLVERDLRVVEGSVSEWLLAKDLEWEILSRDLLVDSLFQLAGARLWNLASAEEEGKKHQGLLVACEETLGVVKRRYLPGLARRRGVEEDFKQQSKKAENSSLDSYVKLGDLEFALAVWRQNLKRDLAFSPSQDEKSNVLKQGYLKAESLVKRCLNTANLFWNTQGSSLPDSRHLNQPNVPYSPKSRASLNRRRSMSDMPLGGDSVITVYQKAIGKVAMRLEDIAVAYNIQADLDSFLTMDRKRERVLNEAEFVLEPESPRTSARNSLDMQEGHY
jgi:hypothetical protein